MCEKINNTPTEIKIKTKVSIIISREDVCKNYDFEFGKPRKSEIETIFVKTFFKIWKVCLIENKYNKQRHWCLSYLNLFPTTYTITHDVKFDSFDNVTNTINNINQEDFELFLSKFKDFISEE